MLQTEVFGSWLSRLKDPRGKGRIIERIRSAERGNFGDSHSIGSGVSEMRVHSGPGYRVYFVRTGKMEYVLLCGGSKRGQKRDIARALELAHLITGG
jgi:putative addiction module killer protein